MAIIKFHREYSCLYLSRCYALSGRKYGEALALTQQAFLHIREARGSMQVVGSEQFKEKSSIAFPSRASLFHIEEEIILDERAYKANWFSLNGGKLSSNSTQDSHQKPLFFDIALNYIDLDVEVLHTKAQGLIPQQTKNTLEPTKMLSSPTKAEEKVASSESSSVSRLGGLLSNWWGGR
jgi:signal recognition particle subunit SRP68